MRGLNVWSAFCEEWLGISAISGKGNWKVGELSDMFSRELQEKGQVRTAEAYRTAFRGLLRYTGGKEVYVKDLSPEFLSGYELYMQKRGNNPNTISFYMRNLRAIYNKGARRGLYVGNSSFLFSGVYTGIARTIKRSVSTKELAGLTQKVEEFREKETRYKSLLVALYYFLFCFYARGMSFVDLAFLKKVDVKDNMICYRRHKTGQLLEVKVTAELRQILRFFAPEVRDSEYLFPIIRNPLGNVRLQYESALRLQNRRLKEIGRMCRLPLSLSTHVARHSWATMAKMEHVPLAVISESLGHSSVKTTSIYLSSFEQRVLDQANRKVARGIQKAI